MSIPDCIPSVYFDLLMLGMEASGKGRFVIQMELVFAGLLDAERLMTSLDLMLDAEPVLGCRLVPERKLPYWQRLSGGERKNFLLTADKNDYLAFLNRGLDCTTGPQLQACLFRREHGDKLLLKVAHQVADAGGVKDIAAKLSVIYNRLEKEPGYKPKPNITGCRDLSQIMRHVPFWVYPSIFINFLRQNWSNAVPASTLHLDLPQGPTTPLSYIIRRISAERMEKIKEFGKTRNATINDVMVAAHYRALLKEAGWDNKAMLRLQTTIDLRRWYLPGEKAGGICNLSVYEYPNLGRIPGRDMAETVELVSRRTRSRKNSWFGLTDVCLIPLLKVLAFETQVKLGVKGVDYLIKKKAFPNALTNMGEIKKEIVRFGIEPSRAYLLPPFVFPPLFGGGMSMYQGEITLCAGIPVHVQSNINRFYQSVVENLPG